MTERRQHFNAWSPHRPRRRDDGLKPACQIACAKRNDTNHLACSLDSIMVWEDRLSASCRGQVLS